MPALSCEFLPLSCEIGPPAAQISARVRIAALSPGQTAVFFPVPREHSGGRRPLRVSIGDTVLRGPLAATQLDLAGGGKRQVVLLRADAETILRAGVTIAWGAEMTARYAPDELQSPLVGPAALLVGLAPEGALRFLRLLLTTGSSLFGGGVLDGFDRLAAQLLTTMPVLDLPLVAAHAAGRRGCIATYRAPGDLGQLGELVLIHRGRAQVQHGFRILAAAGPESDRLDLFLPRTPPKGSVALILGPQPVRLVGHDNGQGLRALPGWYQGAAPPARAAALALLGAAAAGDAKAAAQAAELRCPPEDLPRLKPLVLAPTGAGLLYALAAEDPRGLIAAVRVSHAGADRIFRLPPPLLHPAKGPLHVGYLSLAYVEAEADPIRLDLVTRSGRILPQTPAEAAAFDGAVPEALAGLEDAAALDALAAAIGDALASRPVPKLQLFGFGAQPAAPALRVLIGFGESVDYLRAAVTALAVESRPAALEAVVLPGPSAHPGRLRPLLEELQAISGVTLRLAVPVRACHEAEALRAVIATLGATDLIRLADGFLPGAPGWLRGWRQRLASAQTPRLLHALATRPSGQPIPGTRAGGSEVCIGLNRAAAAALLATPLATTGFASDAACLAARLGSRRSLTDRRVPVIGFGEAAAGDATLAAAEARIADRLRASAPKAAS